MKHYRTLIRAEEWLQRFTIVIAGFILTGAFSLNSIFLILSALLIINDYFDREADKKKINNRNPISKNLISKKSAAFFVHLTSNRTLRFMMSSIVKSAKLLLITIGNL